jgi:probable F420-dependent oxidoreductase
MRFGLFAVNMGACLDPAVAIRIAVLAEELGFDSLWAGEHVVLPDPRVPPSPMEPDDPILDPIVALTFLAAHTSRVLLGTGVIILPQRNPLVLAKELASLDLLSGGRVLFGAGVGYLEPEFRALGVPFADRGPRTDDSLAAMRAIWNGDASYSGRFTSFAGIRAEPGPYPRSDKRHVPLVIGGHSPGAYRRAVEQAEGWYGFGLDPEATARSLSGLREAASRFTRPQELGDLEISVTPRGPLTPETVARFAALGVHRLIVQPPHGLDEAALTQFVRTIGKELVSTP